MTRALNRSISFWILVVASIGLIVAGSMIALDHLGTMTATLKDGSATGLEVYAGQSWIVIGTALLGAGALGILLALALAVASTLLRAATAKPVEIGPLVFEEFDEDAEDRDEQHEKTSDDEGAPVATPDAEAAEPSAAEDESRDGGSQQAAAEGEEPQNGSNGSTATATKISVK